MRVPVRLAEQRTDKSFSAEARAKSKKDDDTPESEEAVAETQAEAYSEFAL